MRERKRLVINVVARPDALREGSSLQIGLSNHCGRHQHSFHIFLDLDDTLLTDIFNTLNSPPWDGYGTWDIIQSSQWNFSITNFSTITWNHYCKVLADFPHVHTAYAVLVAKKGYGVLRIGGKRGVTPRALYTSTSLKVPRFPFCKVCRRNFLSQIEKLKEV